MPKKKTPPPLPEVGTVYLMTLPNGLYSTCRIVRHTDAEEAKQKGCPMALVAASAWNGAEIPDLNDSRIRDVLVLNHHFFTGSSALLWVDGSPPEEYRAIGILPSITEEIEEDDAGLSGWLWFGLQAFMQWRWEHEHEAVLREDAENEAQREAAQVDGAIRHRKYLAALTLKGLRRKRWFAHWRPYVSAALVKESRAILVETIDALIALGSEPTVRARIRILRACIYRFNVLDDQNNHFIATIEREDICEAFDEIVYACGLHECKDLADRWRDW